MKQKTCWFYQVSTLFQDQIHYKEQLQEERRRNEEYEYLMGQQAEREYQDKLKTALDNPVFERLHPMRRALLNK
jgi:hypothetical protein